MPDFFLLMFLKCGLAVGFGLIGAAFDQVGMGALAGWLAPWWMPLIYKLVRFTYRLVFGNGFIRRACEGYAEAFSAWSTWCSK